LGQLVGLQRILDREGVKIVMLLKGAQFLDRGIGDADPDEFGLVLRTFDLLVDRDLADALAVAIKIGGDDGHSGSSSGPRGGPLLAPRGGAGNWSFGSVRRARAADCPP